MKTIFKAFAKKLFGTEYERLKSTLFVCIAVFLGLYITDFKVEIAPFILYLMVTALTSGIMWQMLSSEGASGDMQNMLMLPFENRSFVAAYVTALGIHTFLTKTAVLLSVIFALSVWRPLEILGSILCIINAVLATAAVFSLRKCRYTGCLWAVALIVSIFFLWNTPYFLPSVMGSCALALLILRNTDGYSFYSCRYQDRKMLPYGFGRAGKDSRLSRTRMHHCIRPAGGSVSFAWRYLFRYLLSHKNYLANTAVMWGVACVLPLFLRNAESLFVLPVGFAILSLNTPICILLSADPDFEQAVRTLPGQKNAFCLPYCLFIFMCNLIADALFLLSWQIQFGGISAPAAILALFFAFLSAVLSVLLEWFYPLRNWKTESDLWHHPRKYAVPLVMLLLAGITGTLSL